jgi:hypothetical protein
MSEQRSTSRTVFVLTRGARGCLLLATLVLLLGAYLLVSPIDIQSPQGPMFACGSGLQPPTDQFQKNVCGRLNERRQVQAGFLGGAAVILAVGGLLVFGSSRREERAHEPVEVEAELPPLHRP